jgi:hypothetical protein
MTPRAAPEPARSVDELLRIHDEARALAAAGQCRPDWASAPTTRTASNFSAVGLIAEGHAGDDPERIRELKTLVTETLGKLSRTALFRKQTFAN